MEMEFDSPGIGAAYFREMYGMDEKGAYIEYTFPKLDAPKQQLVITLIHDLLPQSKKDALLGTYLQAFLDDYKMTYVDLSKYITAYVNYSVTWKAENSDVSYLQLHDISSKLQKFLKGNKGNVDNIFLKLVSGFFRVSPSTLITGKGESYYVDLDELKKIVDKEKLDADTFLEKHFQMDFDFSMENSSEKDIEHFKKYIDFNASVFAKIVSEQFNIEIEDILKTEECWIELEDFPIRKYYDKLTDKNKEIVKNVLFYLNIKTIDK